MLEKWGQRQRAPGGSGKISRPTLLGKLVDSVSSRVSGFIDAVNRFGVKEKKPLVVVLIEKGYAYESVAWQPGQPYLWRFNVSGDELLIIYNSGSGDALWVTYYNDRLTYKGNYAGVLMRYPYVFDYIENI